MVKKLLFFVTGFFLAYVINSYAVDLVQFFGTYNGEGVECPIVTTDQEANYSLALKDVKLEKGKTYEIIGELADVSICQSKNTVNVHVIDNKTGDTFQYVVLKGNLTKQQNQSGMQPCYILHDGVNKYGLVNQDNQFQLADGQYAVIGKKLKPGLFMCRGANITAEYLLIKAFAE